LLVDPGHQEDAVVGAQGDQEHEGHSGNAGSAPANPKTWSKTRALTPSAAANDSTTVATSSRGEMIARSTSARMTRTITSTRGTTRLRSWRVARWMSRLTALPRRPWRRPWDRMHAGPEPVHGGQDPHRDGVLVHVQAKVDGARCATLATAGSSVCWLRPPRMDDPRRCGRGRPLHAD